MTDCLFEESHFAEFGIALHQVAHDEGHLNHKFPVGILASAVLLFFGAVLVPTLIYLTIFFCPRHCLGILFVVVNTFFHAAKNFSFVHAFVAHAQVFLEEVLVYDTAGDTHTLATYRKVTFTAHRGYSECCTRPAKNLFCYVSGDRVVGDVLYVMTVDAKRGKSLLCVTRQHCCEIYRTGAFCAVETPNCLGPMGVHVHSFRTVAPARSYRNSSAYAFAFKLSLTRSSFCYAANRSVSNNTFNGSAVGMLYVGRNKFGNGLCQIHCLFFKALTNATLASVNSGTNPNFRILAHEY